jgi:predicted DNA-binding protein with PD1-like motif
MTSLAPASRAFYRLAVAAATIALTACLYPPSIHPPAPVHGSAPGMKFQRLSDEDDPVRRYAIVFAPGDEILGGLTDFAEQERVSAAQITAIGGVQDAMLGIYDRETLLFRAITVGQAEVTSLVGDVASKDGHPVVHAHMNVAIADGTVQGGHLLRAHVWPTLEVILVDSPAALHKEHDAKTGIDLIAPAPPAVTAAPAAPAPDAGP